MAKPMLIGPDFGFVSYPSDPKGRLGVLRLGRQVAGSAFTNPGHSLRLARESDLAGFLAQRIEVTVAKFQYAMAQSFVLGEQHPLLIVEGARLQHGQGHSSQRADGNRTLLRGTEAAHYGIGTITQQGDALSVKAARDLLALAGRAQVAGRDIPATFEASGQLISYGLAHDASTYVAPAMVNRVEGMLEGTKQRYLLGVLPSWIPSDPAALEGSMNATGVRVANLLIGQRASVAPILARLDQLRNSPSARELWQDPQDPDPGNKLFGNQESQLLEAELAAFQDSSSPLLAMVDRIIRRIPERTDGLIEVAVEAAKEQSEADGGTA